MPDLCTIVRTLEDFQLKRGIIFIAGFFFILQIKLLFSGVSKSNKLLIINIE